MKITFYIREAETNKKKGPADNKKLVSIRVRLNAGRGIDLHAKTLISVHPEQWSKETENYRQRSDNKNLEKKKQQIKELRTHIEDSFNLAKDKGGISSTWLSEVIERFHNPNLATPERPLTLTEFIQSFIGGAVNRKTVCYKQQREYATTFHYFKEFCKSKNREYNFKDIDLDFYDEFKAYLESVSTSKKAKRLMAMNTVGKKIQTLKIFLNDASYRNYEVNPVFKSKKFAAVNEESDAIYLNESELTTLYNLDLSETPWKDRLRDLFLVGCWTGLRFGDYYQVTPENMANNKLTIRQGKTEGVVVIPLHPVVRAILEKYQYKLPRVITNQKFNTALKEIAKQAKFNTEEHKSITRGGIKVSKKYKKWEMVSTHTARRSFATNLYKSGFPSISIMKITGHKTEAAFLKYIKVTPDEHARMLEDHWNKQAGNLMVV